ncbi:MAG TPA: hypothetical protein VH621_03360 [Nitrososphaera sp.]
MHYINYELQFTMWIGYVLMIVIIALILLHIMWKIAWDAGWWARSKEHQERRIKEHLEETRRLRRESNE